MTAEKKKRVGNKKVHLVLSLNNGGERINTVAHVGVTADDVYAGKSIWIGIFKHGAPP